MLSGMPEGERSSQEGFTEACQSGKCSLELCLNEGNVINMFSSFNGGFVDSEANTVFSFRSKISTDSFLLNILIRVMLMFERDSSIKAKASQHKSKCTLFSPK